MLKTKLFYYFLLTAVLALPFSIDAHTVCVSSDRGALEAAIKLAEDGDTLLLQGGTYHLQNPLHIDKSITIRGKGKNSILEGSSSFSGNTLLEITAPEVTLADMLLTWETIQPSKHTFNICVRAQERGAPLVRLNAVHHVFSHRAIHTELSSVEIENNIFYAKNHDEPPIAVFFDSPSGTNKVCQNTFISIQDSLTACYVSWDLQKVSAPLHMVLHCSKNVTENSTLRNLLTCDLPIANNRVSMDLYADENQCCMDKDGSSLLLLSVEDAPSHSGFAAIKNLSITNNHLGETPTALATFLHKTEFFHLLPPNTYRVWKIQNNTQGAASPPNALFRQSPLPPHLQAVPFFHGCFLDIAPERFGLSPFPEYPALKAVVFKHRTPAYDMIQLLVEFPEELHPDSRAFSVYADNKALQEVTIQNKTTSYVFIIPPIHFSKKYTYTLELHHKNLESQPSQKILLQRE